MKRYLTAIFPKAAEPDDIRRVKWTTYDAESPDDAAMVALRVWAGDDLRHTERFGAYVADANGPKHPSGLPLCFHVFTLIVNPKEES